MADQEIPPGITDLPNNTGAKYYYQLKIPADDRNRWHGLVVYLAQETTHSPYGPFLLKLPYYHQKMKLVLDRFCFYKFYFFYMITDRCIYLNQDHFVTKLNNCFLISGRTFYPQKLITVTMEKCNC